MNWVLSCETGISKVLTFVAQPFGSSRHPWPTRRGFQCSRAGAQRSRLGPDDARRHPRLREGRERAAALLSSPLHVSNDLCSAGMIAGIQGIESGAGKGGFRTEQPAEEDDAVLVGNLGYGIYDLR